MDNLLHIFSPPLSYIDLFLFISFFLWLIFIWKKFHAPKDNGKLPPGPPMLPIIGNIHQLIRDPLPHVALRKLSNKYGPLMYIKLGQVPHLVVSSAELAREVLINQDPAFADRPTRLALDLVWYNYEDLAFSPYSEHWKLLRKICVMELLSGENVRSFRYIREDEIAKLSNKIRLDLGKPINLTNLLYRYSASMTCRAAFGSVSKNNDMMIKWLKEGLHLAGGFNLADVFPSVKFLATITGFKGKLVKLHKGVDGIIDDVLKQHKVNHAKGRKSNAETGDEDLLDVLLRHKESGSLEIPISDKNVKSVIFDIFTGGTDTSASTLQWAMSELMKHPEVLEKAQKEIRQVCKGKDSVDEEDIQKMSYMKMVIKETLRLHPTSSILPRACRQDCEVNGYKVAKGTQLALNIWALARDPKYWDDPESFIPERFAEGSINFKGSDFQYIPFGAGRRICPGLAFGLASLEMAMSHLLFHFNWSLPSGMKPEDFDMEETFGITVGRKSTLNLVATAYDP